MTNVRVAATAWMLAAVCFFYQYALRSAPGVMMPDLSAAFGISAAAVASIVGVFYYGYSPFSLVAGTAMDRFGPGRLLPAAVIVVGAGALLFATGNQSAATVGRFMQGAGGAFAPVGAIYIATTQLPPSMAATLVGATQMFGMAGGAAGQFAVGPVIASGVSWDAFWIATGLLGMGLGVLLFLLLPRESPSQVRGGSFADAIGALGLVFRNPQSILCGLIAGLIFIPTTIFDMVWGVRYLQDARGLDYGAAVMRSATVPVGWIIGCPLVGLISDRLGRRKPVIVGGAIVVLACLAWILYGVPDVVPPYVIGLAAGAASGVAMIPYTVIKEANPPQYGGTATGVINFINFTFSALLGPVFAARLQRAAGGEASPGLLDYQIAFAPLLYGMVLAIILVFFLRETGRAARQP